MLKPRSPGKKEKVQDLQGGDCVAVTVRQEFDP